MACTFNPYIGHDIRSEFVQFVTGLHGNFIVCIAVEEQNRNGQLIGPVKVVELFPLEVKPVPGDEFG